MHEMALMGDILQLIQEDAAEKGLQKIDQIELVVGEVSNAMPDALVMAFAIYKEQNPQFISQDAELIIHPEEAKAECVLCGANYRPDKKLALCPECNMPSGKVISGETFQVLAYEGS